MKRKLCGVVAQIMYECAECGILPDSKQIASTKTANPFYIMTHPIKEKAILIGIMYDADGTAHVRSYQIDFRKWNWAASEGFDITSIFKDSLYTEIFEEIHPSAVSEYLVSSYLVN